MSTHGRSAAALLIALTTSSTALASPSAKLVYVRGPGAESCPSEDDLRKAVGDRIGYDPFFPSAQKTVVVQITRTSSAYGGRVQIVTDTGELRGERQLPTLSDCTEMVASLGLVVSLALDDLDASPEEPAAAAPAAKETPEPAAIHASEPPPPPPEAPPPSVPRPAAGVDVRVSVGPGVMIGTAPSPAVALAASTSLGRGRFRARLDARADAPAGEDVAPAGHLLTNSLVGAASGCFLAARVFGCVGAGSGFFFAHGEALRQPASDSAALVVAVGRLGMDVDVGSTAYVEPSLEVGANLLRHRVDIDSRQVFRMSPVWVGAGFHLGMRFF
jgi:hypothetical protein